MFEEDQKLRVPGPDEPNGDVGELDEIFVLTAAVSLVLGLSFFLYQYEYSRVEPDSSTNASADGTSGGGPSRLERRAERLSVLYADDGLANYQWAGRDIRAAYRFGPRAVAETACRISLGKGSPELHGPKVAGELLAAVDRLAAHAPWSCLFRTFFSDARRLDPDLAGELRAEWERVRTFEAPGRRIATVLRDFTDDGFVPDDPTFRRWVRLCALNFETHEGGACRELLAEVAPEQGADLVDVVEVHLRTTDLNPSYDTPILIAGLGQLAAEGQPPGWRITETDALPDYDTDLRLGAIFYLCRFANSPDREVADLAAQALSRAADYGVRPGDGKRRPRWLSACRKAFGGEVDGRWTAPSLAVWTGDPEEPPTYALRHAIERGDCRVRDDHPRWYCGAAKWNGTDPDELTDFYVATSGMEWEEPPMELR